MRRLVPLLIVAAVAAVPASAQAARGFTYGVAAGDVTADSAIVWAHANKSGNGVVEYSTDKNLRKGVKERPVRAKATDDNTAQVKLTKLKSDAKYYFRFKIGSSVSDRGSFKTAPKVSADKTIEFAFTGDADATPLDGQAPVFNNFQVYGRMASEGNNFNINLGDTIYSDSELGGLKPALTAKDKWTKYKLGLGAQAAPADARLHGPLRPLGRPRVHQRLQPRRERHDDLRGRRHRFRDYQPVTYSSRNGLYRSFRWGKSLEMFMLDERSFRDAKASADHVCDNPETKQPDLAPTAPQSTRDTFALVIPSFKQPVSKACLDTINSSTRTFLGTRQYNAFTRAIELHGHLEDRGHRDSHPAVLRPAVRPLGGLRGGAGEAARLPRAQGEERGVPRHGHARELLQRGAQADARAGRAGGHRLLRDGHGPVATNPFDKEINPQTGRDDAGDLITAAFFKPEPPNGVGMNCAAYAYSYTQVKVTKSSVTLTPKDLAGKGVKEKDGKACGPFTISKK